MKHSQKIPGIKYQGEFITTNLEQELIKTIDSSPWLTDLSRRVQHYGWKYDYKARKIDESMNLGPLPYWAQSLSEKIHHSKEVPFLLDQVIVNEYIKNQSISKHTDCTPCFKDGIAIISLLEGWEMTFSNPKTQAKFSLTLEPRSLLIMTGEARYSWLHEIPKRLVEPSGLVRGRRVSLTFRKVDI